MLFTSLETFGNSYFWGGQADYFYNGYMLALPKATYGAVRNMTPIDPNSTTDTNLRASQWENFVIVGTLNGKGMMSKLNVGNFPNTASLTGSSSFTDN